MPYFGAFDAILKKVWISNQKNTGIAVMIRVFVGIGPLRKRQMTIKAQNLFNNAAVV